MIHWLELVCRGFSGLGGGDVREKRGGCHELFARRPVKLHRGRVGADADHGDGGADEVGRTYTGEGIFDANNPGGPMDLVDYAPIQLDIPAGGPVKSGGIGAGVPFDEAGDVEKPKIPFEVVSPDDAEFGELAKAKAPENKMPYTIGDRVAFTPSEQRGRVYGTVVKFFGVYAEVQVDEQFKGQPFHNGSRDNNPAFDRGLNDRWWLMGTGPLYYNADIIGHVTAVVKNPKIEEAIDKIAERFKPLAPPELDKLMMAQRRISNIRHGMVFDKEKLDLVPKASAEPVEKGVLLTGHDQTEIWDAYVQALGVSPQQVVNLGLMDVLIAARKQLLQS